MPEQFPSLVIAPGARAQPRIRRVRGCLVVARLLVGSAFTAAGVAADVCFPERLALHERVEREHARRRAGGAPARHVDASALAPRVERSLAQADVLESRWGETVTAEMLSAELHRMASGTRDPAGLQAILDALGSSPAAAAEALAWPAIVARRFAARYAWDPEIHRAARAEADILRQRWSRGSLAPAELTLVSVTVYASDPARVVRERALPVDEGFLEALRHELPARGGVGAVEETAEAFVVRRITRDARDAIAVDSIVVPKESPESWLARQPLRDGWRRPTLDAARLAPLPITLGGGRSSFHDQAPDPVAYHVAVWTGAEMIVWGGQTSATAGSLHGSRYDPATDTWTRVSATGAPAGRWLAAAVWTGQDMVVWGGVTYPAFNLARYHDTGGRYDPATDTWRPMSRTGAPGPRAGHLAVFSGTELVVWGGFDSVRELQTGGRYDVATDTWRPTATGGATPAPRRDATAVWTGSEMIVWGGRDRTPADFGDGGRYDPVNDTWVAVPAGGSAPVARARHTAVWTGAEMIVWGGDASGTDLASGGRYVPTTGTWSPTATLQAPAGRKGHGAVFTGNAMVVWGGEDAAGHVATGGRYVPATDTWSPVTTAGAPLARLGCSTVWTGSAMVVWGGATQASVFLGDGSRYDPAIDAWIPVSRGLAPSGRTFHTAVWTGGEMIVWGGQDGVGFLGTGARYDDATDTWWPTSTGAGAASPRSMHLAVWTGQEMIVWGGQDTSPQNLVTGSRYDPLTDAWRPMTLTAAPSPRHLPTMVFTGSEAIVWGGYDVQASVYLATGGRYDPVTDAWQPTATTGAPRRRSWHTAAFTGSEMIVWGGQNGGTTGGRYDPAADAWTPTSTTAVPQARQDHTAVWTGQEMVVWAGLDMGFSDLDTGGRYDPVTDTWQPTSTAGVPRARDAHVAVWTGQEMVVWGGFRSGTEWARDGGRYDPATDTWRPTTLADAPTGRIDATAVFTGREMVVWGGLASRPLDSGGRYDPAADAWSYGPRALQGSVLAAKGPGGAAGYDGRIRGYRVDGSPSATDFDALPSLAGHGAHVAAGDVGGGARSDVLACPGPGAGLPPRVRGFRADGTLLPGLDVVAYGAPGYGADVGHGRTDGSPVILTAPGPSPVYGPHVRGFRYTPPTVTPLSKVSF